MASPLTILPRTLKLCLDQDMVQELKQLTQLHLIILPNPLLEEHLQSHLFQQHTLQDTKMAFILLLLQEVQLLFNKVLMFQMEVPLANDFYDSCDYLTL